MKTYEALSMLLAARDGVIPKKHEAVQEYGEVAKDTLREIGMKDHLYDEYPEKQLRDGIFLMCNHPTVFAAQARASAAWLLERN